MSTYASTKSSNSGGNKYRSSFAGKNMKQPFGNQIDDRTSASMSTMPFEDMSVLYRLEEANGSNPATAWVKTNKTLKKEKLTAFSEKYAAEHSLNGAEKEALRVFLCEKIDEGKLNRVKDTVIDKHTYEITSIPGLLLHPTTKQFCLRSSSKAAMNVYDGGMSQRAKSTTTRKTRNLIF